MIDDWRCEIDDNKLLGVAMVYFSKAFDMVCNIKGTPYRTHTHAHRQAHTHTQVGT
jgi:hypothetical protein